MIHTGSSSLVKREFYSITIEVVRVPRYLYMPLQPLENETSFHFTIYISTYHYPSAVLYLH